MESTYEGTQDRTARSQVDSDGEERVGYGSEGAGAESQRTAGSNWPTATYGEWVIGKMLDQLIDEARDQLVNAQACIKWYQDEETKALKKLERLQELRSEQSSLSDEQ